MNTRRPNSSLIGLLMERYLALKRALGRGYDTEGRVLAQLDQFLVAHPQKRRDLTAETFAAWCATLAHLTPTVRRNRMRIVRNLCLYRRRTSPHCFVPDPATFPQPHSPRAPHIFTEQEVLRLLHAAKELQATPTSPLRSEVFRLALVLLYTAGLRRGELVRLTLADYEPRENTLLIRASKFHKSRIVPLSGDAGREMIVYLLARRRLPHDAGAPLLCSRHKGLRHYSGTGIAQGLRELFRIAAVRATSGKRPRIHDLRHTFALHALLRWYRAGADVQAKLAALATYMGHVSVASTQHYLRFLTPLAGSTSELFARHCDRLFTTSPSKGEFR